MVDQNAVDPKKWDQYEIPESGNYVDLEKTIPYDYTSVMHYGKYSFVKKNSQVSGISASGINLPCLGKYKLEGH